MNMKKNTYFACLRGFALGLTCLLAVPLASAATVIHNNVAYTTGSPKTNVSVAKSTSATGAYTGEIVIPETFEEKGITYTVVGVAANAFKATTVTKVTLPKTCVNIGRNAFIDCAELTNYPVPEEATTLGNGAFKGCKKITEAFIPGGVTTPQISETFSQCSSLKKFTIKAGTSALRVTNGLFGGDSTSWYPPIEELVIERDLTMKDVASNQNPFRGAKSLKKVVFGGEATTLLSEMFSGCPLLETVEFAEGNKVTALASQAFKGCKALKSIVLPNGVTVIPSSAFASCTALQSVTLGNATTTIADYSFSDCKTLKSIELPATVTSIQAGAFNNSGLSGALTVPAAVQSIGTNAFAGTKITSVSLPASVTTIGEGAFAPITTLAGINVADGNAAFKVDKGVLTTADGKRLLVVAHHAAAMPVELSNDAIETVDPYGLAYSPYKAVKLSALKHLSNNAFQNADITEFTLKNGVTVGSNLFSGSKLAKLVIEDGRNEVPQGLCNGCAELSSVTLSATTTNMMKDAFANCPKLASMEIPGSTNYMEPGSVPSTIKSLRVLNVSVPVLAAGVFTPEQKDVECKVAANAVDNYKAAGQWQYLNIVADNTISGKGATLGCPTGLYFATKDGKLLYKDEQGQIVDTKFATGDHAFNLASYKNRIYVGVAGKEFRYQSPTAGMGDGEVFYVNRTGDIFYRVTVLNNVGYEAFQDPFSMTIIPSDNKIYIADRNVGIHEMSADTVGLYGAQPFFLQNQWLPYYGDKLSWGAIGAGFAKDSKNVYWMGKKFNGLGIFRFTTADIYPDGGAGKTQNFKVILADNQITTFYLDETHGYLYFYLQKSIKPDQYKPGVYRIALADIAAADAANAEVEITAATLIDDSPVLLEGADDEITGVTQISGDDKNVYWAYIATTGDDKSVLGSVALDEKNPLHHSGIKYVAADGKDATVKFAVEGIEAYGVVPATFVPDPSTGVDAVVASQQAVVKGADVIVPADATVNIYSLNGALVANAKVAANGSVSLNGMAHGLYLVRIAYANGAKETVKVIR